MQHMIILDGNNMNNMIIFLDSEKAFVIISWKKLKNIRVEGMYLYIIKTVYVKPIANIVLNIEKLKTFPINSEIIQVCPSSSVLSDIVQTLSIEI